MSNKVLLKVVIYPSSEGKIPDLTAGEITKKIGVSKETHDENFCLLNPSIRKKGIVSIIEESRKIKKPVDISMLTTMPEDEILRLLKYSERNSDTFEYVSISSVNHGFYEQENGANEMSPQEKKLEELLQKTRMKNL